MKPKIFVLDVDGVLTNGQFLYDQNGKSHKIFGADDSDALKLLEPFMKIFFVTADKRGFPISKKRVVDDMGYPLELVSSHDRINWIEKNFKLSETIYMGDGFFDNITMSKVSYSIAPSNSDPKAKDAANYVTSRQGGDRAVAEACMHLLEVFFNE